jgi:hypothetical protein
MTQKKHVVHHAKLDYFTLATSGNEFLEEVLKKGTAPDAKNLAGWEFKGFNTLDITRLVGIRKFKKGFYADGETVRGYNVKIKPAQSGLMEPWVDIEKNGQSVKHGWYDIYPVREWEKDNLYPNSLLLNYACEKNPKLDPSRFLRDYLVQVDPKNPDLLLGKAYVALGGKRVFMSFFILQRENRGTL